MQRGHLAIRSLGTRDAHDQSHRHCTCARQRAVLQAHMASALGAEEAGSAPPSSLPCLDASDLISRDCGQAFHDVRRLANILSIVNLDSRREDLLDYIRLNRARFIKSYVSVRWLSGRHGELVVNASNALAEARAQREQIDTVSTIPWFTVNCRAGNLYRS